MATATSSSRSSAPSSAVAVLVQDHRDVEALFKRFEGLGGRAHKSRDKVVARMIAELTRHAAIEEAVFYPEVRAHVADVEDEVLEALEEHHVVKWTLSELESMQSTDERFGAKVTVLIESVRHHVKEEERGLFPKVRKSFTRTELEDLGVRLTAAKKTAITRPHPRSPDTPPGNLISTALTAPVDAARNAAGAVVDKVREAMP